MKAAKQVVTVRLEPEVLSFVDHNVNANDESRSSILNYIVKQHMKQLGMTVADGGIVIEPTKNRKAGAPQNASDIMNRIR